MRFVSLLVLLSGCKDEKRVDRHKNDLNNFHMDPRDDFMSRHLESVSVEDEDAYIATCREMIATMSEIETSDVALSLQKRGSLFDFAREVTGNAIEVTEDQARQLGIVLWNNCLEQLEELESA